jgi:hypothetical protein
VDAQKKVENPIGEYEQLLWQNEYLKSETKGGERRGKDSSMGIGCPIDHSTNNLKNPKIARIRKDGE